eukprot:g3604.t1
MSVKKGRVYDRLWLEMHDKKTGETYYFHEATGEIDYDKTAYERRKTSGEREKFAAEVEELKSGEDWEVHKKKKKERHSLYNPDISHAFGSSVKELVPELPILSSHEKKSRLLLNNGENFSARNYEEYEGTMREENDRTYNGDLGGMNYEHVMENDNAHAQKHDEEISKLWTENMALRKEVKKLREIIAKLIS